MVKSVDRRGFSLTELLVVMAVMAVLLSLGTLVIRGIAASQNLGMAAGMIVDQLSLAQQYALTKNVQVRWQIFKVEDPRNKDPEAFRLMRTQFFDTKNRKWETLGKTPLLPIAVIGDPADSTLLQTSSLKAFNDVVFQSQGGLTKSGATIIFQPNGRTTLNPNDPHSLTLRNIRSPDDFITVKISPVTGRTRIFRP